MTSLVFGLSLFFLASSSSADEQFEALKAAQDIVSSLNLRPLQPVEDTDWNLYRLGEKLFFEKDLSGNRNVSCASCHRMDAYSGDGLPLGVGQGASFKTGNIQLKEGGILSRHTPHLVNVGYDNVRSLFWDARIAGDSGSWRSPIKELNGENPERADLAEGFKNRLALQTVFPLITDIEMMGYLGDNEIADQPTAFLAWEKIVDRVLDPVLSKKYRKSFQKAFPDTSLSELRIYHLGNALSEYIKTFFASFNTPYDQFLRGDQEALDLESLKGMAVFFGKGNCAICHNGPHLSNFQPLSSGAPQINRISFPFDTGFEQTTGKGRHKFLFKTPALRNIALTPPYMHSGALESLEEVVKHYTHIGSSLRTYELSSDWISFYDGRVYVDKDRDRNELRRLQVRFGPFLSGLRLTQEETDNLVHFLRFALTDQDFKNRLESHPKFTDTN